MKRNYQRRDNCAKKENLVAESIEPQKEVIDNGASVELPKDANEVRCSVDEPPQETKDENPTAKENLGVRHLKVSVYAIAKNEAKFAARWMESMKEADEIVVLDTGSNDDTVKILSSLGAKVTAKVISPWRFDVARNESMKLVSPDADILVCTDLDEVFVAGWRRKLEEAWLASVACGEEPTTAQYEYVWNFGKDGADGTKFWYEKIHGRKANALWIHPVHEVLSYGECKKTICRVDGMRLEHHADPTKSRSQYLPLLEMAVAENPDNDRYAHYLGREYMFRGRHDSAIAAFRKHLSLPSATWKAERAASMRYMARCYAKKGDALHQEIWLLRAICEDGGQREAALELAEMANARKDWQLACRACEMCLSVKERRMSYLTDPRAWGPRPHQLYGVALWYLGKHKEAIAATKEALEEFPADERLAENERIMKNKYTCK